jgi:hypothetical protein
MTEDQKKCGGEEYGFSPIECDNPATTSVKVEDEYRVGLCAECYDAADAIRTEAWEYAYRHRR